MMNVLANAIKEYSSISAKQCRELKFCNGGHLFAASMVGTGNIIQVYNFYTGDLVIPQMKGHNGRIRCIDWWEDDMGFTSCASDGTCYFYDLIKWRDE